MSDSVQPLRRGEVVSEWLLDDDACTIGQASYSELLDDIGEKRRWNRKVVRRVGDLSKSNLQPREGVAILVVTVDVLQVGQELVESTPVIDTPCSVFDAIPGAVAQLLEIPT